MTNLPALLMALILGGSSVASVVCIGVCEDALPTNCHQEIGISGEPAMTALDGCGAPAYSVRPFVKEQRPPTGVLFFVNRLRCQPADNGERERIADHFCGCNRVVQTQARAANVETHLRRVVPCAHTVSSGNAIEFERWFVMKRFFLIALTASALLVPAVASAQGVILVYAPSFAE